MNDYNEKRLYHGSIEDLANDINIANKLDDKSLLEIGDKVYKDYLSDKDSRQSWWDTIKQALKIAKQSDEHKNWPWEGAANIRYPLIVSAIVQYNSRTYPEVVKGDKVVNVDVLGEDSTGLKEAVAKRLAKHMSYQLLKEVPNWEQEMDRLLMVLAMMGTAYKKIYYDSVNQIPIIDACSPEYIIVNNSIKSLNDARRITHIVFLNENDIYERITMELFSDFQYKKVSEDGEELGYDSEMPETHDTEEYGIEDGVHPFIEQHMFYDLDGDGYQEPYIVMLHIPTRKVVRMVARFVMENVKKISDRILSIKPDMHFIDYHFIPSPDGSFHSMGFGSLLYHMNHTANTIINNLIDAGTLNNTGGGFIASALNIKKGPMRFRIGEYQMIDATIGTDLRANIFPIPAREPSHVLFQLLGMLIQATKEMASVSDIMQGQENAQNSPATTVLALIEQGLKIYTAIQKRLYLALSKEFTALYNINRRYMDRVKLLGYISAGLIQENDYQVPDLDILPVADPKMASDAQRLAKAQMLMSQYGKPEVNNWEILNRWFQATEVPNQDKILPQPQPRPPSPEELKITAETDLIKMKTAAILMERELEAIGKSLEHMRIKLSAEQIGAQAATAKLGAITNMAELELKGITSVQISEASKEAKKVRHDQSENIEMNEVMRPEVREIFDSIKDLEKRINVVLVGANQQNTELPSQEGMTAGGGTTSAGGSVPQTPDELAAMSQQQGGQQTR